MLLHATSVAITNKAVLLVGASGVGKSDLALRLIDNGATLISDDQTLVTAVDGVLVASAPPAIKGLIEVRHVGLLKMPNRDGVPVALSVELVSTDTEIERLPEPIMSRLDGIDIPHIKLPAFAASSPAKIRAVLGYDRADIS